MTLRRMLQSRGRASRVAVTPAIERLRELLAIMARLRAADGCPWDREQTFASIAPYTIEEAYEVADAIARGDMRHLKDELGDLLFQVVFHAQMASEANEFDFEAVAGSICDKLLRRHPHVFGAGGPHDPRGTERRMGGHQGRRAQRGRRTAGTVIWTGCRWRCPRSCARSS